jgi:hypothetical protein
MPSFVRHRERAAADRTIALDDIKLSKTCLEREPFKQARNACPA